MTIKLAAWLAANPPGSMPLLQPANWEMFRYHQTLKEARQAAEALRRKLNYVE